MGDKFKQIMLTFPDERFVRWADLDDAIIGLEVKTMRLIYSVPLIIEELKNQGMPHDDAVEWYTNNIECAYIGERTPIHCDILVNV